MLHNNSGNEAILDDPIENEHGDQFTVMGEDQGESFSNSDNQAYEVYGVCSKTGIEFDTCEFCGGNFHPGCICTLSNGDYLCLSCRREKVVKEISKAASAETKYKEDTKDSEEINPDPEDSSLITGRQ